MRLGSVRRHWNRLARRDPYWAVLTSMATGSGTWDPDRFFETGREEVAAVLARAAVLGVDPPRRRALDFGCGVGRVTQALAGAFDRADGADISSSMLREARARNRHPDRCAYHRNTARDLSRFRDEDFSFVFSTLVLQHMDPRDSTGFIGEFLRVLAPDGLLVFQLPSHFGRRDFEVGAPSTRVKGRLPAGAHRAAISSPTTALSLQAGGTATISVDVTNASTHVWPALPNRLGRHQIFVANHWLSEDGTTRRRDDGRCPLPHDLAPGGSAEVLLRVEAPRVDGRYLIELDLVQEDAVWFAQRGSPILRMPCLVTGGESATEPSPDAPAVQTSEPPPFRERHPKAFAVLRDWGVRDLYWMGRRGLDAVKARRDAAIRRVVHPAIERLGHPLANWWQRRPFDARMEMHCVPRDLVQALVERHGGRVVAVDEELVPDGYHSCRYWVVRKAGGRVRDVRTD